MNEKDIMNLRLEIMKLVYTHNYSVSEIIVKAQEIEKYIITPAKADKVKVK